MSVCVAVGAEGKTSCAHQRHACAFQTHGTVHSGQLHIACLLHSIAKRFTLQCLAFKLSWLEWKGLVVLTATSSKAISQEGIRRFSSALVTTHAHH